MKKIITYISVVSLLFCQTSYGYLDIQSDQILNQGSSDTLRQEILRKLGDPSILKEMKRVGVNREEIELRLAGMSDAELVQLRQTGMHQVGGDVVVISATSLIIILLVLILIT